MLLQDVRKAINTVYADKPVLAQLCFAQALLESNLDKKPSKLALDCYNLFGIKAVQGYDRKDYVTSEFINGQEKRLVQSFTKFPSFQACIEFHRKLMQKPRYAKVWVAKTFEEACKEVWKAGYATDPKYPSKLMIRYNSFK